VVSLVEENDAEEPAIIYHVSSCPNPGILQKELATLKQRHYIPFKELFYILCGAEREGIRLILRDVIACLCLFISKRGHAPKLSITVAVGSRFSQKSEIFKFLETIQFGKPKFDLGLKRGLEECSINYD